MRKLLMTLTITAAFAAPAAASAHGGWHHHHHHALAKLSGTGTLAGASGTMTSKKLGNGTFTAAVTATGAATTRTGDRGTLSCAPATATISLVSSSTKTLSLTGKRCTWTPTGSTTSTSGFWGKGDNAKALLVAKSDGTVKGAVFSRRHHRR
jgi:hypothetical protein